MFKNYLKVAIRNIIRQKGHSFINIIGLSVGMAICLLLFLWIMDEVSYDRYHEKADRIYRVVEQDADERGVFPLASTPAPLGPSLVREFPWIQKAVRFSRSKDVLIQYQDKLFRENIFFADPGVFDVFTFPMVTGDPKTVLKDPYSILISEDMQKKYFGNENPIGKTITLFKRREFKITGIFKNIPLNSHFRFHFLGSFLCYRKDYLNKWWVSSYYTYILIAKDSPLDSFKERMPQFVEKYMGKKAWDLYKRNYFLQPITDIHLHSKLRNEIEQNRDISTVYIFTAIALFILLVACLNYINLATARFSNRAREVGLRKVLGATSAQLIKQFLGESLLFAVISLPLAVLLAEILLPVFNSLSGKTLAFQYFDNLFLLAGMGGIVLLVGLISGLVPALFISAFHAASAIKGMLKVSSTVSILRRCLVVFQFSITIIFIIGALIISNQLHYINTHELGLKKENISVRNKPGHISQTLAFLKNKWQEIIPGQPFVYSFLDEDFDKLYKIEFRLQKIFSLISILAILISCLGLFGLASFAVEQRTKEIGIRKVYGASVPGIVVLLSKEFTLWVLAANIFAWPIAWYAMNKWLQNFSFRVTILPWTFLLAALVAIVIALMTVSYKAVRAAVTNPVETLRYE